MNWISNYPCEFYCLNFRHRLKFLFICKVFFYTFIFKCSIYFSIPLGTFFEIFLTSHLYRFTFSNRVSITQTETWIPNVKIVEGHFKNANYNFHFQLEARDFFEPMIGGQFCKKLYGNGWRENSCRWWTVGPKENPLLEIELKLSNHYSERMGLPTHLWPHSASTIDFWSSIFVFPSPLQLHFLSRKKKN